MNLNHGTSFPGTTVLDIALHMSYNNQCMPVYSYTFSSLFRLVFIQFPRRVPFCLLILLLYCPGWMPYPCHLCHCSPLCIDSAITYASVIAFHDIHHSVYSTQSTARRLTEARRLKNWLSTWKSPDRLHSLPFWCIFWRSISKTFSAIATFTTQEVTTTGWTGLKQIDKTGIVCLTRR